MALGACALACARHDQQGSAAAFRSANASSPATMGAPSTTAPTSVGKSDATTGGTFTHAPSGITLSWPEGWKQQPSDDYVWVIVPANSMAGSERWISLDVPDLPWHPPGMIPIGSVESGYLNDLRGKFGKIETKELTPPPISDAKLRMVSVGWQQDGKSMRETALLIVHNDHVYILRAHSVADDEQATRETFDAIVSSIQWITKK